MGSQTPSANRAIIAVVLFGLLTFLGRTDAVRSKVGELPTVLLAIPVLLLGLVSVALSLGPARRLEKEAEKMRRTPVPPGASQLGTAPLWVLRTFCFAVGIGITALGLSALFEAYG